MIWKSEARGWQFLQDIREPASIGRRGDSDLDARKMCFAALYRLEKRQVRFLKAFAHDIGANPFLVHHVQCLETLDLQTTDFNIPFHTCAPWSEARVLDRMGYGTPISR